MAQTISASRGSQAYNTNNSAVTLFTNSASGSSRIIINSMMYTIDTSQQPMDMILYIRNTGGGYDVPFAISRNAINAGMIMMMPGNTPIGQINNTSTSNTLWYGTTLSATQSPNDLRLNWTSASTTANNLHVCPKSIWLGPSDSIIIRARNDNSNAGNIVWNFTCILET